MATIAVSQLGYDEKEWDKVLGAYVPYAWDIVTEQSIYLTHLYTVQEGERLVHESFGDVLSFKVVHSAKSNGSTSTSSYTAVCPRRYAEFKFIPHMRTCQWSNSAGFPCRHAARAPTLYK